MLQELANNTFAGLSKLRQINLSNNRLLSLKPGTFASLQLDEINLSGNLLTSFELQWIGNSRYLLLTNYSEIIHMLFYQGLID